MALPEELPDLIAELPERYRVKEFRKNDRMPWAVSSHWIESDAEVIYLEEKKKRLR